ncbi:MAG: DUF3784 domain-containing protein [Clostridiales bacterium]|nr:DUF3784 domain-containing protein [Clostridiales bacterium]
MTVWLAFLLPALLSLLCLWVSVRHFQRKGAPWNNTWLYASETERQQMDTAPLYRQTGVVFALLCALFVALAVELLLHTRWLCWLAGMIAVATAGYAIVSSAMMERQKKPLKNQHHD